MTDRLADTCSCWDDSTGLYPDHLAITPEIETARQIADQYLRLADDYVQLQADTRAMRANFVHTLTCRTAGCPLCLQLREAIS